MKKYSLFKLTALCAVVGAAKVAIAHSVATRPPDPAVAARAREAATSGAWTHHYADVNGLRMHYAEMGAGPLVILLHGYPQCWYAWRRVMQRLAEQPEGFRVVAPDMRGYNETSKPAGVDAYGLETLSQDVVSLIEALGERKAHIVGHDWGGVVAWHLGAQHAGRVEKLAVLNAPHPAAYLREVKTREQSLRSLYVLMNQIPVFAEALWRLTIRDLFAKSATVPGAFPREALDVYENAFAQPGAATATLNYYRATFRNVREYARNSTRPIEIPTLLIWGINDVALSPGLIDGLDEWVHDLRVVRVPESGHWVPEEAPQVVAGALAEFFRADRDNRSIGV